MQRRRSLLVGKQDGGAREPWIALSPQATTVWSPGGWSQELRCLSMSKAPLQQAVQLGAAGFTQRVRMICGAAALAHQVGARQLGAHVVIDPVLPSAEVLVTAERIGS